MFINLLYLVVILVCMSREVLLFTPRTNSRGPAVTVGLILAASARVCFYYPTYVESCSSWYGSVPERVQLVTRHLDGIWFRLKLHVSACPNQKKSLESRVLEKEQFKNLKNCYNIDFMTCNILYSILDSLFHLTITLISSALIYFILEICSIFKNLVLVTVFVLNSNKDMAVLNRYSMADSCTIIWQVIFISINVASDGLIYNLNCGLMCSLNYGINLSFLETSIGVLFFNCAFRTVADFSAFYVSKVTGPHVFLIFRSSANHFSINALWQHICQLSCRIFEHILVIKIFSRLTRGNFPHPKILTADRLSTDFKVPHKILTCSVAKTHISRLLAPKCTITLLITDGVSPLARLISCKYEYGTIISSAVLIAKIRRKLSIASKSPVFLFDFYANSITDESFCLVANMTLVVAGENRFGMDCDGLETLPIQASLPKYSHFGNILDDVEARDRNANSFLTILVSNVRGGLGGSLNLSKKMAIKAASCGDTLLSLSECNCVESDARMLAATFGRDCRVSSLEDVVYKNGLRCTPVGARKKLAFGSCIVSKDAGLVEWVEFENISEWKFELVPVIITRGWIRGLKIGGYRSPSMTNQPYYK